MLAGLDEPVRRYFTHAIRNGAPLRGGVELTMAGRIKAGRWLPFTARQEVDGRSFIWEARVGPGPLTLLRVVDRYEGGGGSTEIRLFGRVPLSHVANQDTTRSAAGRAALESVVFAPPSVLPQRGVEWRAASDELIVATFDLPPERPEVRVRIDDRGTIRDAVAARWGNPGQRKFEYVPCGCEIRAERRFGDLVIPSSLTVGWWFGTVDSERTRAFRAASRALDHAIEGAVEGSPIHPSGTTFVPRSGSRWRWSG